VNNTSTADLGTVRLNDPSFYAEDVNSAYALLRREAPVYWYEPVGLWALSKYADIKTVTDNPALFSSLYGLTIGHKYLADQLPPSAATRLESPDPLPVPAQLRHVVLNEVMADNHAESPQLSDPPRHAQLRGVLARAFTPRAIGQLEGLVRQIATEVFDEIQPGDVRDLMDDLAVPIPTYVTAGLLGIPRSDRAHFRRWAVASNRSAEPLGEEDQLYVKEQLEELYAYLQSQVDKHRAHPQDDLISRLINAEIEGRPLNPASVLSYAMAIFTGGIVTTASTTAGAAKALTEFPGQRQILVQHPELTRNAVDEFLRWVTPVLALGRTAKAPTQIRGQAIAAGDFVLMLFASGNRDEEVWDHPEQLDVTREFDPMHLAFGFAEHNCLGQNLARLELRIIFEELLRRFPDYELAGEVRRRPSVFMNATESMPVRFA
jgi:cytochrome P450